MSSNGTGGLSRRRVPGAIATGSGAGAFGLEDDAPSTARRSASPIVTASRDGMRSSGEGYGYGSGGSSSHHAGPSTPRRDAYGSNGIGSPGVTSISRSRGDGASVTVTDQSGHKVAYDPRDLNDDEEAAEHPKLTLMEEVFLMGLKDRAGYLSFWNDNISYALRGTILLELAIRGRIGITRDPGRRQFAVQDRIVEVLSSKNTGEVLLDEALKVMKGSEEPMSCAQWVDLLSGETWNWMKIGFQMKQVRERLAKGLVDKGILRTEKKNFLLFDMATHPLADPRTKEAVLKRVVIMLASQSTSVHAAYFYREEPADITMRVTRALCLLCSSYAANVLENALTHLSYDARENAFQKADEIMNEFSQWPMAPKTPGGGIGAGPASVAGPVDRSRGAMNGQGIGEGSVVKEEVLDQTSGVGITELARALRAECTPANEPQIEAIAAVLAVLAKMDSLVSHVRSPSI